MQEEWGRLAAEIRRLCAGERVYGEIKTTSIRKQEAWLVEQIARARGARNALLRRKQSVLRKVGRLQERQQELIRRRRELNGKAVVKRRQIAQERRRAEAEAIEAGRFWECSEKTLKDFFHVPFRRRKLVDVDSRHRAALFVEVELQYDPCEGYERLLPTDRAYLCGVDDNGEEWGFVLRGPWLYTSRVVDAMAVAWGVKPSTVGRAQRQGELLVWPSLIPEGTELRGRTSYDLAPSHTAKSPSLRVNGEYLASDDPIEIVHPTHQPLRLEPGTYRWAVHGYGD